MSNFKDQYKINLGADQFNFSKRVKDGTLSEQRNEKKKADAAAIIEASAGGLDSVTNFVSMFMGNQPQQQQATYEPMPNSRPKVNPWLIGGIAGTVLLLILFLILAKNGKTKA